MVVEVVDSAQVDLFVHLGGWTGPALAPVHQVYEGDLELSRDAGSHDSARQFDRTACRAPRLNEMYNKVNRI